MTYDSGYDYDGLKGLAGELKRPVSTLIALAPVNDPFYAGAPARLRNAEWFAELWDRFQFPRGIHLRGIFYVLVSQREPVRFPDGTVFKNTVECWASLGKAARDARHLDLVPSDYWIDRKSTAVVHLVDPTGANIIIANRAGYGWDAPSDMPDLPRLMLMRPEIAQPYHVELWCEKTTINDILLSLAEQYGLNIITGEGDISSTQCDQLVDRAVASERPVRILYISDFDPAGQSMPVAVARKVEHALYRRGLDDLDIQVRPVALTKDQVIEFDIPPIPLKESDRRAPGFREQHGDLAAELDALEALNPGELRRILIEEIERYCDPDLAAETSEVADEIDDDLADITKSVHEQHRGEIDELAAQWAEIATRIEAWKQQAETAWLGITVSLEEAAPAIDGYEWPEPDEADEDPDPLFDSARDYVEQIDRYKLYQDKPITRRKRNGGGS